MTIYGMSGLPRSGKSYSVVANVIIPSLKQGRIVYHNMMLNDAALMLVSEGEGKLIAFPRECTADELIAAAPPGAMIVIDESVRYWPVGIKANQVPKHQLEFFTMHGHNVGDDGRTTDICIICQDFESQCAAFIRALIELNYYSVKLTSLGLTKKYRLEVYNRVIKGEPNPKKLIKKSLHTYRPEIYNCYVSHTNAQKGVAGEELSDRGATIWRNWGMYATAAAFCLAPLFLWAVIHSFWKMGHPKGAVGADPATPERSEGMPGQAPKPVAGQNSVSQVQQPSESWSSKWRYAGTIVTPRRGRYYVVDGDSGSRLVEPRFCTLVSGNMVCRVDGAMVALWSGPAPALVNSFVQATLKPGG